MFGRHKSVIVIGLLWIVAVFSGVITERFQDSQTTRLTFLSVGQGDCTVFQHQGATILVDVGPASEYSDAGARLVTPALKRLGVGRIDMVILTHPDADHVGGLVAISKRFGIGRLVMAHHFRSKPEVSELLAKARIADTDVIWSDGDQTVQVRAFHLRMLTPEWQPGEPDNDGSIVVQIGDGKASSILSGDASALEEQEVVEEMGKIHSQILKTGHHGSRHSSCESWVKAVAPEYAVISVGRNNRYGHPAPEVVDRLRKAHVRMLRTDQQGDIQFVVGKKGFELEK
jgi:competence protein ComEC